MELQTLATSRYGVGFALTLARTLPPPLGYRVAYALADFLALFRRSIIVRSARLNQWVVHNMALTAEEIDEAMKAVLRHAGQCAYDLYRHINDSQALLSMIEFDEELKQLIKESATNNAGYVVVGPHLSNFDLGIKAAGIAGVHAQILAITSPTSGYLWQNRMRSAPHVEVTPISPKALFKAYRRLQAGGIVVTGVDRPVPGKAEMLSFFGHPAPLPTGHVRLAMNAGVPVRVVAASMDETGKYHLTVSERIPMRRTRDKQADIRENAQRVLEVVEWYIRRAPLQWTMFHPVWPHLLDKVPTR